MAQDKEHIQAGGKQAHSVLDGPGYISGVAEKKGKAGKGSSRKREDEECGSVLDAPECIQGVNPSKRRSSAKSSK